MENNKKCYVLICSRCGTVESVDVYHNFYDAARSLNENVDVVINKLEEINEEYYKYVGDSGKYCFIDAPSYYKCIRNDDGSEIYYYDCEIHEREIS